MSDIVKMLERELSQLETSLRANPTFIKIERIRELLAAYKGDARAVISASAREERPIAAPIRPVNGSSKRVRMFETIDELLKRGPTHRKAILNELMARGVMGTEKNPMQAMAIFLSDAKGRYRSVGEGVWDLAGEAPHSSGEAPVEPRPPS